MSERLNEIVARAVAWSRSYLGSAEYTTRCLAFVEDAYERPNGIEIFGGDTAHESAVLYQAGEVGGEPPVGAFVFYDCCGELRGERRNWGHVGMVMGEGMVIHAWDVVRIDHFRSVTELTPPPAWTAPAYVGWVCPERILLGHQQRDWGAVAAAGEDTAR
ncbi:MAG: NlpC/P60 family protein [Armatimonadia bacterium]